MLSAFFVTRLSVSKLCLNITALRLPLFGIAVLPSPTGKYRRFVNCGLSGEIEFGRPPACGAVFEFKRVGKEAVAAGGSTADGFIFNLEVSGFFELMGIGNEIGLLGAKGASQKQEEESAGQ